MGILYNVENGFGNAFLKNLLNFNKFLIIGSILYCILQGTFYFFIQISYEYKTKEIFSGIIVLLAVTVLGLNRSIFAVDATENSDSEYERIIATDMIDATDLDTFVQIGKSIEEPLMQKQDIKQARNVAKKYIT